MMAYFIQVNLCWAALFALYTLLLRRETFFVFNRIYLLLALALGLSWPLVDWSGWLQPEPAQGLTAYLLPLVQVGAQEIIITPDRAESPLLSYWVLAYWAGVCGFGLRLLWSIWRLFQMGHPFGKASWQGCTIIETGRIHSPFSFFWWIFIGSREDYTPEELAHVLAHERAHVQGWHSFDNLIIEVIAVLFWCSPIPFLFRQALRLQHEYLADAVVLRGSSRRKYGQLLLQQTLLGGHPLVAHPFISSFIKKRIAMMTKTPSRRRALWKYAMTLPVMLMLGMVLSLRDATAQTAATGDEEILLVVEEMPRFPGCEELSNPAERKICADNKMMEFIFKNLKYPAKAKDEGLEGTVVVSFVVEKDGSLSNLTVLRGLGGGASEEVLRIVNLMNENNMRWTPGRNKGRAVRVKFALPIRFKLHNEAPAEAPAPLAKDSQPLFAGCTSADPADCSTQKLMAYIGANLKYPAAARNSNIEGMAVAAFIVDETGKVTEARMLKPLSPECDNEVLRLLNEMPRWIPAQKEGKAVKTELTLPIKFKIPLDEPGLDKKLAVNGFEASPNPSNGIVRLRFKAPAQQATMVRILDTSGKEVASQLITDFNGQFDQSFDLTKAAKGTLIVQISQEDAVFVEKLVLQ